MSERKKVTSVTLLADELIAFADNNPNAHYSEEYGVITMATCREVAALRDRLYTAERERDEARRERDALKEVVDDTYTDERGTTWGIPTAFAYARACLALGKQRHRAERAERVLRTIADDYDHDMQTRDHTPGYGGMCRVCEALRALDAHPASEGGG